MTPRIPPRYCWLLAKALDTTPEFWLNLQNAHDLAKNKPAKHVVRLRAAG